MPDKLIVRGARQHNLKNINVEIPRDKLVVITGVSGSGKSSLAMDTIYAEGQRRYIESLSTYARQFLGELDKPDVDSIEGLSPAIAIEQRSVSKNPRSTVGTVTEIHDYLRLLFASIGIPHCPNCGKEIKAQTAQEIIDQVIIEYPAGSKLRVLAPVVRGKKGEFQRLLQQLKREGYTRVEVDGEPRMLEEEITLNKNQKHDINVVVDRIVMKEDIRKRLTDSIEASLKLAEGIVRVDAEGDQPHVFSEHYACEDCGISLPEITPRMFSFNNPYGYCKYCQGLGSVLEFDEDFLFGDRNATIHENRITSVPGFSNPSSISWRIIETVAEHFDIDLNLPLNEIPRSKLDKILMGTGQEKIHFDVGSANGDEDREFSWSFTRPFEGILPMLQRRYMTTNSQGARDYYENFMVEHKCTACKGARLRPETLAVTVNAKNIAEISSMTVEEAKDFFETLDLTDREALIVKDVLKEIRGRFSFLQNVGLTYLSLDRATRTLSGGESERIRLATQIGSNLVGVLYVLDEPSIGLHPRDKFKLINMLKRLRDVGNTVLVVEHDEDIMRSSDFMVDLGPGAGEHGGEVVGIGTIEDIMNSPRSLTGDYLSGRRKIFLPANRRPLTGEVITIHGARENNLKNIDVEIPLRVYTCVTGVSGAGKSTLIVDILYKNLARKINKDPEPELTAGECDSIDGLEQIDKVINIDQQPIGRTPRSCPATYSKVLDHIRDLFAKTPDAKERGFKKGRFSFNVKGGRCEKCEGKGFNTIEMQFLPEVMVTCETCHGSRFNSETLQVKYKGKSISEVLTMSHTQALEFFENVPKIKEILQTVFDVGLGYVQLGQPATTLSGGEAQRIKLAKQLSKRATGNTLYTLDEPTTGLHFFDIENLLAVLQRLVDRGNTVIVIEHNMDIIKSADFIIDMGPEGGAKGGEIVATGTPEEIAANPASYTGQYLQSVLPELATHASKGGSIKKRARSKGKIKSHTTAG
ncbi:MAG TPA: excinuclease ABC subunit UvrA [Candidatus Lokiarchaeia archaeon]|nr:excinuclease ABC subunit UvrA [Candidatus Lokiarchaeia archaeon]